MKNSRSPKSSGYCRQRSKTASPCRQSMPGKAACKNGTPSGERNSMAAITRSRGVMVRAFSI